MEMVVHPVVTYNMAGFVLAVMQLVKIFALQLRVIQLLWL